MVLSNKKLKQKLRAKLFKSITASVSNTHQKTNHDSTNPDPKTNRKPLKHLLDSATQKPRLSKRQKRREILPSQPPQTLNTSSISGDSDGDDDNNKKKKRDGVVENVDHELLERERMARKEIKRQKRVERNRKREDDIALLLKTGDYGLVEAAKLAKKQRKGQDGGSGDQGVAEDFNVSESQQNEDDNTKVYVGGIPYYSTEDDIRSYFEGCGTITEIDCMMFPESGKFRGIAIVNFKTGAAAKRALALDGADMGGLFLKIQPYQTTRANKASDFAPEIVEGYNRIYVGNLSWDITEDDLRKLFSDCSVSSIRFGMDKETGEFRGYAHVDFSDSLSRGMALKLDQQIVCGRPVKIRCAVPKKGAETPLESGSGKKKRRTCYECGEPGHLSSSCPKKQTADPVNSSTS